jgi:hypothetical protein
MLLLYKYVHWQGLSSIPDHSECIFNSVDGNVLQNCWQFQLINYFQGVVFVHNRLEMFIDKIHFNVVELWSTVVLEQQTRGERRSELKSV